MARKKEQECKSIPGWLVSFSDLMSLLLTFFILLYAMSTVDITKAMKFLSYFQGENPKFAPEQISVVPPIVPFTTDVVKKVKKRIKRLLPVSAYQIVATKQYVTIRLFNDVLFEPGSYNLTPKAKKALNEMADTLIKIEKKLKKVKAIVKINGHSSEIDKENLIPGIKDLWELSLKRASSVADYLIYKGVDPSLISISGYGTSRPLYKWKHPMLQRRNSRVEIQLYVEAKRPDENKNQ